MDIGTLLKWMPDRLFLTLKYFAKTGKWMHWNRPTSFNEKIQWLKVYDRNPEYTLMVDKYEAKKYVAARIGEEYIIPTLGVWDSFDEIDFDKLPKQFVLKCTHDSGGLVIVKDKDQLDLLSAKAKIEKCLKRNYFWGTREWPYKNVQPRIIAEKYMVDESGYELKDYKLFTFNGFVKALYIATDRQSKEAEMKWNFYDMNFEKLPFWNAHPNSDLEMKRPESLSKMRELVEKLSKGIPHVRVDFYDINGQIYFGEMTFYHNSGFSAFHPEEWDYKFGEWIKLPDSIGGGYLIANKGYILWIHEGELHDIMDYKFFCLNGVCKCMKVDFDRFIEHRANYYDIQGNLLDLGETICPPDPQRAIVLPKSKEQMMKLAEKLSINIPLLRVDFYEVNGKIFFGELTFFPASGFGSFIKDEWDYRLGSWLMLSDK